MTLATQACQSVAELPGYVVPCPAGSVVGLPSVPDLVRRPDILRGNNSGSLMFSKCYSACPLCEAFERTVPKVKFSEEEEAALALAWARHVFRWTRERPLSWARRMLPVMQRRGWLPAAMGTAVEELSAAAEAAKGAA